MEDYTKKTITIGKLKMSLFSFIVALSGLVIGLISSIKINIVSGLVITLGFFLAAYNLNCVIVGHCRIWAWVLLIVYLINIVTTFSAYTIMRGRGSSSSKKK